MTRQEVFDNLQGVFDSLFIEPVVVTPELAASDVEEWDSLSHISLVLAVEKKFGIRFRVGEVEATHNIGDFADLILRRLEGVPHPA
jgi:acyl carrier protein